MNIILFVIVLVVFALIAYLVIPEFFDLDRVKRSDKRVGPAIPHEPNMRCAACGFTSVRFGNYCGQCGHNQTGFNPGDFHPLNRG